MKKVKFMLMSMAVLAIIGGALAFKAKYSQTFCTITAHWNAGPQTYTYNAGDECVDLFPSTTTTDKAKLPVFTTLKPVGIPCNQVTCTTFTYAKRDI